MIALSALTFHIDDGIAHAQTLSPLFPVELRVPMAPAPFKADGKQHLVYELHVTNLRNGDLTLSKVEVFSDDVNSGPLATYQDVALSEMLGRPGAGQNIADKRVIGAGMRAVIFLWLSFDPARRLPDSLHHRLYFKMGNGDGGDRLVEGGHVVVAKDRPIIIGPPLRGSGWVARNIAATSFHRRGLIVVNGNAVIAQRFAIDWGKYGDDGRGLRSGAGSKNSDYYGYGDEVIAVADGVVREIRDDIPENTPGSSTMAVPITLDTVTGNHVVLDIGRNRFALYAHLQPKSIRVKVGQHVRRGQPLGLLGNSGNATGPHLHFHITDSPAPIGGEGLPYAIDSFEVLGVETPRDIQNERWTLDPNHKKDERRLEMPSNNMIIRFH